MKVRLEEGLRSVLSMLQAPPSQGAGGTKIAGFIIFWVMCGGVAALIASSKGGSGGLGFVVGALFGPLGIVAAFFMGSDKGQAEKQIADGTKKKCSECAELVQPDAKICRYCGHEFPPPPPLAMLPEHGVKQFVP